MLGTGQLRSPEDEKILQLAREVCRHLGLSLTSPRTISWADRIGLMKVPFGQALFTLFDEMILPRALMGKLEPEEWRPLIASSAIFRRRLQRKSSVGFAVRMGLPIVPVMIIMILVFPALGERPPSFLVATVIVALISSYLALAALAWSASLRYMKRMALKADSQSAEYVGREKFLEVLKKLESPGFEKKGLRARIPPRLTIRERIQNLESSK